MIDHPFVSVPLAIKEQTKTVFSRFLFFSFVIGLLVGSPELSYGQYLGCYADKGDPSGTQGRDLDGEFFWDDGLTIQKCVSACETKGYRFAGVQYSNACYCGTHYGSFGRASNCNMPCAGDAGQECGGEWANSVYKTDRSTRPGHFAYPSIDDVPIDFCNEIKINSSGEKYRDGCGQDAATSFCRRVGYGSAKHWSVDALRGLYDTVHPGSLQICEYDARSAIKRCRGFKAINCT